MKIAIMAAANNIHTARWANALAQRNCDVHLISMHDRLPGIVDDVQLHKLPIPAPVGYFLDVPFARRILRWLKPDLLHVHYAGGYGTLGRLSAYRPLVVSVWGREIYDVPEQSRLHRSMITANVRCADWVCSTSEVMADRTEEVVGKIPNLTVTPFGVDLKKFQKTKLLPKDDTITIGTVKTLRPKYGIDTLIQGFAECRKKMQKAGNSELAAKLRLLIVGGGPKQQELEALSRKLCVDSVTTFTGSIPHDQVPHFLNHLDVYVAVSRLESESFGVAIIEASACEVPVIVSNVGGLPEVVSEGETGFVVPKENPEALADKLTQLVFDSKLRAEMGAKGRQRVGELYDWEHNVSQMMDVYEQLLDSRRQRAA